MGYFGLAQRSIFGGWFCTGVWWWWWEAENSCAAAATELWNGKRAWKDSELVRGTCLQEAVKFMSAITFKFLVGGSSASHLSGNATGH